MGRWNESGKIFTNPRVSSSYICSKVILGLQLILGQKGLASAKEIDCWPATENDYHNAAEETKDCPIGLPMRSVMLAHVCFAVAREGSSIVVFSQPMECVGEFDILAGKNEYNWSRELTLV